MKNTIIITIIIIIIQLTWVNPTFGSAKKRITIAKKKIKKYTQLIQVINHKETKCLFIIIFSSNVMQSQDETANRRKNKNKQLKKRPQQNCYCWIDSVKHNPNCFYVSLYYYFLVLLGKSQRRFIFIFITWITYCSSTTKQKKKKQEKSPGKCLRWPSTNRRPAHVAHYIALPKTEVNQKKKQKSTSHNHHSKPGNNQKKLIG